MAKFQRKPEIVTAVQWFKLGDHEDVIPLSVSYNPEECHTCNNAISSHGWSIKIKEVICPGDWIVTDSTGTHVMSDGEFKEKYEPCTFDIGVMEVGDTLEDYHAKIDELRKARMRSWHKAKNIMLD